MRLKGRSLFFVDARLFIRLDVEDLKIYAFSGHSSVAVTAQHVNTT